MKNYGTVNYQGNEYTLINQAEYYCDNQFSAPAIDADGNEHLIVWDMTEDAIRYMELQRNEEISAEEKIWMDEHEALYVNDNSAMCDWDSPCEVF